MQITFDALTAGYPTAAKDELFDSLGGDWPKLKDKPDYRNTCAVRLSIAIKDAGGMISPALKEAVDGRGSPLIIKVKTMEKQVRELFGESFWGMSKKPKVPLDPAVIPKVTGIIVYHAMWSNATGHFDLWTGAEFIGSGNWDDIQDGYDVALWRVL
jgi:Type VI secretion system (T6SS), amidase effector protein 4